MAERLVLHRATKSTYELRVSFDIPASDFRLHAHDPDALLPRQVGIFAYETAVRMPKNFECDGVPAGIWMLTIQKSRERIKSRRSVSYEDKDITASLSPHSCFSGGSESKNQRLRDFQLEFFVGNYKISDPSLSSIFKGSASCQNGVWECTPARIETNILTASKYFEYYTNSNSMTEGTQWSLELMFYVKPVVRTVPQIRDKFESFADDIATVLKCTAFSDCTLISADRKRFPVHRVILAAQSPVFSAMFTKDMLEKSAAGVRKSIDCNGDILEIVLDYLYGRVMAAGLAEKVEEVAAAAHDLEVKELATVCENLMLGKVNKDTAVHYLGLSVKCGLSKLMKVSAKFVVED